EDQRTFNVLRGPELRQARDAKLGQAPEGDREQEQEIDYRRDQRQQNLEEKNIGYGDPTESSVAGLANGVAGFPDGLQRAEGPAEALANQGFDGLRDFGAADGIFVVENLPAFATDGEGEVGIFGNRVARKSAVTFQNVGAPGAGRAGHDRD